MHFLPLKAFFPLPGGTEDRKSIQEKAYRKKGVGEFKSVYPCQYWKEMRQSVVVSLSLFLLLFFLFFLVFCFCFVLLLVLFCFCLFFRNGNNIKHEKRQDESIRQGHYVTYKTFLKETKRKQQTQNTNLTIKRQTCLFV